MKIQNELRENKNVEFEGVMLEYVGEWRKLVPGDTYVAERNQGPRLLTVRVVKPFLGVENEFSGAVFPVENAYPYDLDECVKVNIVI